MALTIEIVNKLRAPFAAEAIKWKVQTNPKEGDKEMLAVVVCYLDARDVAERLDLATGGDWSSDFAQPQVTAGNGISLECRLTVCGVTRVDVGTVAQENRGDNTKDLYSDALKRAAVQFGVGSHIYRFPTVKARVEKFGNSYFLTFDAQRELLALTQAILNGGSLPKYQHIKVRGSAYGAEGLRDEEQEHKPMPGVTPRVRPTAQAAQNGNKVPYTRAELIGHLKAAVKRAVDFGYQGDTPTDEQCNRTAYAELQPLIDDWRSLADELATQAKEPVAA